MGYAFTEDCIDSARILPFRPSRPRALPFVGAVVFALIASIGLQAHAAEVGFDNPSSEEAQPWLPDVIADANTYIADPGFHGGEYIEDAFGANQNSPTNDFLGRKVAVLPGGDIVVAALVKNPNGNQTNGFWNIGLVRYSPDGSTRRTWINPGAFSSDDGQYVVYPKADDADYSYIQDIKVIGNFILVSANRNFQGTTDIDTYVFVFDLDGNFRSRNDIFGTTDLEYIGGMEVYQTGTIGTSETSVVVVATIVPAAGGVGRPIFKRLTLDDNGVLTDQTGVVALNVAGCVSTADDCEAKGIALGYSALLGNAPTIFVANVRRAGGTTAEANIAVMELNANGGAVSSWNATTWNTSPGGARADIPFGIAVKSSGLGLPNSPRVHTVYVGSYIDQNCKSGISVLRQTTADNGATGVTRQFGGSNQDPGTICNLTAVQDVGNSLTMQDGKLAIVGYQVGTALCVPGQPCEPPYDAEMAILDDLTVQSFATYPYPILGPRDRHTGLYGVIGTGNGKFVTTGDDRFRNGDDVPVTLRGKQSVAVLGLAPDDTIFANGFD